MQSSAFLAFAVLASPSRVSIVRRIPFMVLGTLSLLVLNLVRIISLYYTGVWFPRAFDAMHIDVWQPIFIFLPLVMWVVWARATMRRKPRKADVHA